MCGAGGPSGPRTCGGSFRDEVASDAASVARFAPGETKRFVVDLRVGPGNDAVYWFTPPGSYAFVGSYGGRFTGRSSAPVAAVLSP